MFVRKTTQYRGDVVMFLLNKIIKNNKSKKLNYRKKNVGHAHAFKTFARPLKNPWFYCTWFRRALQMVLKPCARPPKQPMVLLYMVEEVVANGFHTMCKAS